MIKNALFWLASIKERVFLKNQLLNQNLQLWDLQREFDKSLHKFSTEKVLPIQKYFCVKQHGFDVLHFMAKWSHFYNLPTAAFLNITSKPDMLKK